MWIREHQERRLKETGVQNTDSLLCLAEKRLHLKGSGKPWKDNKWEVSARMRFVVLKDQSSGNVENGLEDKEMEGGNTAAIILLGKGKDELENLGKMARRI